MILITGGATGTVDSELITTFLTVATSLPTLGPSGSYG